MAKLDEYHTEAYPAQASWFESLLEKTSKGSYLDDEMRETLGTLYEPMMYLKNLNKQAAIQARLPYFLTIE